MSMNRHVALIAGLGVALLCGMATAAVKTRDGSGNPAIAKRDGARVYDKNGNPTFDVKPDGTVDWLTFSGYIRYTANCMQCHGPDGMGSSYGPALVNSLQHLSYTDFANIVTNGRVNVTTSQDNVMPKWGLNPNVMCYLDDIYVYLRARSDNAVPRGRPRKHAAKDAAYAKMEDSCMS
ncbi:MAG: c-type cytochrome, methanol metabolism-related [Hyphomicrobiales bacterium]|nr:c-type cytochrome, methanol metabolism-related [Hyphomicrobiales bacterium]